MRARRTGDHEIPAISLALGSTVAKTQPVFRLENVTGTLAGFRFPDFARGLNVPGFHIHFLTEDRQSGGHVLDLALARGELAIDASARFHLELPTG